MFVSLWAQPTSARTDHMSNDDIRYQIQSTLDIILTNPLVSVTVTNDSVVLDGYVYSQQEHDHVLTIAQSYAGGREVVDNIRLGGSPCAC